MTTYTPFTYLIGWSQHNLWYYGVRVKYGTTPEDLWTKYFTSSKKVKQFRQLLGEPDVVQVRKTFDNKSRALLWEHRVLSRLDAKRSSKWINDSNGLGDSHFLGPKTTGQRMKESATRIMRLADGAIKPHKHSEEHKQKLRNDNPGGRAVSKSVCQIDSVTGTITTWPSARAAGIALGISQWRNISTAIKNPYQTVGGSYWRWPDSVSGVDIEELNRVRCDNAMRAGKQVCQLDSDGNTIHVWKNMSEASREIHIKVSNISAAAKSGKKAGGYYWRLK